MPQLTLKFFRLASVGVLLLGMFVAGIVWWRWEIPLISPLSSTPLFQFLTNVEPPTSEGKIVYGFLPYWNIKQFAVQPEMTHLGYFALTITKDGTIQTREEDYAEPGYHRFQSDEFLEITQNFSQQGRKIELVLAQFNNDDIVALVSTPAAHDRLLKEIDSLLLAYPVQGINIDIEYSGDVTPRLQSQFTDFVKKINQHLDQKYTGVTLSIDMYASATSGNLIWNIEELHPHVDYIVVMAYDFHQRSSSHAGPVAPLFGGKELWDTDINHHLQAFVQKVPSEKILLGIPFYGYEWQTTTNDPQAHTFPRTGATASFKRVQELLAKKTERNVQEHWNEAAFSPYVSYKENDKTYVIYYENSRSISYKLDYVNQLDLGGVAIWALGYEGNSRELWDVINRKL